MNNKPINLERDTKLIKRYLNLSKPKGVSDIEFNLEPTGDSGEYYMSITYLVPESSELLKVNPFAIHRDSRYHWNHHITKDIYNFFGLKVIIGNSGIRNEKFNYE